MNNSTASQLARIPSRSSSAPENLVQLRARAEQERRRRAATPREKPLAAYHDRPAAFARECFAWPAGHQLTDYQAEILGMLVEELRVCGRGPRGLGKTAVLALAILWFALTREAARIPWKVPTTAGSWAQLALFLWPEVHLWARRIRWDRIGREPFTKNELLDLHLKLDHGEAFAVASKNTALIEGSHAPQLLYIFDEAQAIPDTTWDGAEGSLTEAGAMALALSRPGPPTGRFYAIHARKPGLEDWGVRHVRREEAVAAGRLQDAWAEQRRRQWGEQSALYQNHVEGNFAAQDESSVIPLSWVEAAVERWHEWKRKGGQLGPLTALALDVADGGEDRSILVPRHGVVVPEIRDVTQEDPHATMALVGVLGGALRPHPRARGVVDSIGVGAGVVSRARELGLAVEAFNAAEGTSLTDKSGEMLFANRRAAAWWGMRERLHPETGDAVALPPDDDLIGDLTAPTWKLTSGGKILIESKDDIRKRLGRSTDKGDGAVMSFSLPDVAVTAKDHSEIVAPPGLLAQAGASYNMYDERD
jgi:hypothetical protein